MSHVMLTATTKMAYYKNVQLNQKFLDKSHALQRSPKYKCSENCFALDLHINHNGREFLWEPQTFLLVEHYFFLDSYF